ncbi:MAG: outer membrane beta-barrel protein [Bacteroidia bacterium]|nr:outer membrane beta-barrel protein [Bacteroidia bacterium]
MKNLLTSFLICLIVTIGYAQDNFSLHFAQTYSKFKFLDSEGNKDDNITSAINYSYGLNYSKIFSSNIFARIELGYKNLGANSILNNQKLDWSLHYTDLNLGGGYIVNKGKLKPFIGASFYFSYLFKAEQSIGLSYYNMLKMDAIKNTDYGLNVYAGLLYSFTESASVLFELRNSTGMNQLEQNSEPNQSQKLYNRALSLHFGLVFSINKK